MDFETSHFGKMNIWPVEHFFNIVFVLTFGRDSYCIQQSRPKVRTNMLKKCSTGQRFIFPKWLATKSILLWHQFTSPKTFRALRNEWSRVNVVLTNEEKKSNLWGAIFMGHISNGLQLVDSEFSFLIRWLWFSKVHISYVCELWTLADTPVAWALL